MDKIGYNFNQKVVNYGGYNNHFYTFSSSHKLICDNIYLGV